MAKNVYKSLRLVLKVGIQHISGECFISIPYENVRKLGILGYFNGYRNTAALQKRSYKKVFWKYAASLLENNHAKEWFQKVAKQLFWNPSLAWVFSCSCKLAADIFSEHLFLRIHMEDCLWKLTIGLKWVRRIIIWN